MQKKKTHMRFVLGTVLASALMLVLFAKQAIILLRPASLPTFRLENRIAYGYGEVCGDGIKIVSEGCDDSNTSAGDGCSATCTVESGWSCTGTEPSVCSQVCGNGIKTAGEGCDDSNTTAGDGCSATCTVQSGWSCTGTAPSVCSEVCGNGVKTTSEGCDDSNTTAADGCSATCTVESGWSCTGTAPSSCSQVCGNGIKTASEGCDDGDTDAGDGCSATCTVESGYSCTGTAPSVCSTGCGDGIVAGAEACDPGGSGEAVSCDDDCTAVSCGDGNTNQTAGEECDNGSANGAAKPCNTSCRLTYCGDGVVQSPNGAGLSEACEQSLDGTCSNSCTNALGIGGGYTPPPADPLPVFRLSPSPNCGNGRIEPEKNEQCDMGRFNGLTPSCDRWCQSQYCGNLVVEKQNGEECEPQRGADGQFAVPACGRICTVPVCIAQGSCSAGCKWKFLPQCTDPSASPLLPPSVSSVSPSVVFSSSAATIDIFTIIGAGSQSQAGESSVERGQSSSAAGIFPVDSSESSAAFSSPSVQCGDSVLQSPEECDAGKQNSNVQPNACRMDCRNPFCGDGVQDAAEECDRGFEQNALGNGCTPTCKISICGNSVLEPGEECDDGPRNSKTKANSCSTLCLLPRCSDGIVDSSFGEICDAGRNNSDTRPDACRLNCIPASCGDGVQDKGEACDDGLRGSPSCTSACTLPEVLLQDSTVIISTDSAPVTADSSIPLMLYLLTLSGIFAYASKKMLR